MIRNERIRKEFEDKIQAIRESFYEGKATPVVLGLETLQDRLLKIRSRFDVLLEIEVEIRRLIGTGNVVGPEELFQPTLDLSVAAESVAGDLLELSVALSIGVI